MVYEKMFWFLLDVGFSVCLTLVGTILLFQTLIEFVPLEYFTVVVGLVVYEQISEPKAQSFYEATLFESIPDVCLCFDLDIRDSSYVIAKSVNRLNCLEGEFSVVIEAPIYLTCLLLDCCCSICIGYLNLSF